MYSDVKIIIDYSVKPFIDDQCAFEITERVMSYRLDKNCIRKYHVVIESDFGPMELDVFLGFDISGILCCRITK